MGVTCENVSPQVLYRQLTEHRVKLQKQSTKRFFASIAVWLTFASFIGYYYSAFPTDVALATIFLSSIPLFIWVLINGRKNKQGCNCPDCQRAQEMINKLEQMRDVKDQEPTKEMQETTRKEKYTADNQPEENLDRSIYNDNPNAIQEDDMEEDLALLNDEDDLW